MRWWLWVGLGVMHWSIWSFNTLLPHPRIKLLKIGFLKFPLTWQKLCSNATPNLLGMPGNFFLKIIRGLKPRHCRPFLLSHSLRKLTYLPPTPSKIQMYDTFFSARKNWNLWFRFLTLARQQGSNFTPSPWYGRPSYACGVGRDVEALIWLVGYCELKHAQICVCRHHQFWEMNWAIKTGFWLFRATSCCLMFPNVS